MPTVAFHSATLLALVGGLCLLYWALRWQTVRLVALLGASWLIYAFRHPPSLLLLVSSIAFNYGWGRLLERRRRPVLLAVGVGLNLASLLYFKYAAFLVAQLPFAVAAPSPWLPLGISFFTFQVIAYLVDVYRGELPAERNLLVFAAFKSFFAQLVAGPIVRGSDFLPQLRTRRPLDFGQLYSGLVLVVAGLFLKVGVADLLGQHVDHAWDNLGTLATNTAWLAMYAYAAQLLADFAGYSSMAVGFGLVFGLTLPANFAHPYGAASLQEFWRRWHITLSFWLRDYLYLPLGGNRRGSPALNRLVTMTLGGLWHGAGWNFVLWGLLHGVWLNVERWAGWVQPQAWNRWRRALGVVVTFHVVALLWVPFRAPGFDAAVAFFQRLLGQPWSWKSAVPTDWVLVTAAFLLLEGAWFRFFPLRQRPPSAWDPWVLFALLVWMLGYGSAKLDFIYFVF